MGKIIGSVSKLLPLAIAGNPVAIGLLAAAGIYSVVNGSQE